MKRTTVDHPKVFALAGALRSAGVPHSDAVARGVLVGLWAFTARHAPRGDVGRFAAPAIERACGWEGEPGLLLRILLDTRWLDRTGDLVVAHEWAEHADRYTHRSVALAGDAFVCGTEPNHAHLDKKDREKASKLRKARLRLTRKGSPPGSPKGNPEERPKATPRRHGQGSGSGDGFGSHQAKSISSASCSEGGSPTEPDGSALETARLLEELEPEIRKDPDRVELERIVAGRPRELVLAKAKRLFGEERPAFGRRYVRSLQSVLEEGGSEGEDRG